MRQWHCYLKLIMPGAKAAVSQIAFVAVDHWRGDPSSCFLLLSAPGASVPLWQRACLCYASSSPSLRTLVVCVCGRDSERERERQCVPVQNWLHVLVAQRDLCVEHVCVPVRMQVSLQCLRSAHTRLMAYRSCNTFFSFNTISKPQHSSARFLKLLIQPSVQPVLGIGKALYSCTVMPSWLVLQTLKQIF